MIPIIILCGGVINFMMTDFNLIHSDSLTNNDYIETKNIYRLHTIINKQRTPLGAKKETNK